MESELAAQFAADHLDASHVSYVRIGDLRYVGQGYELKIAIPGGTLMPEQLAGVWAAFHEAHAAEYGHAFAESPIEIVNVRVSGRGAMPKIAAMTAHKGGSLEEALVRTGPCVFRVNGELQASRRQSTSAPSARGQADCRSGHRAAEGLHDGRSARLRPRPCTHREHSDHPGRNGMNKHASLAKAQQPRRGSIRSPAAVIQGALENIAIEMGHKLMRMSYSSIIRESEDFGAALTDAAGPAVVRVQDEHAAAIGPDPRLHPRHPQALEARGETLRPGDVIMHNDPYGGASHGPDVAFCVPVFLDGKL